MTETANQRYYRIFHSAPLHTLAEVPDPRPHMPNLGNVFGHFINYEILPENSIIIDGGTCVGAFLDRLHRDLDTKNFKIIGFEPCRANLRRMACPSCRPGGPPDEELHTEISNRALVGEGGKRTVTFYEFDGLQEWGHIMGEALPRGFDNRTAGSSEYKVKTTTLNKIFKEYDLPKIDYLKLDIEGAETAVVKTMSQETANKIFQISMEVHNDDGPQLKAILENLGFECIFETGELYGVRKQIESEKDIK